MGKMADAIDAAVLAEQAEDLRSHMGYSSIGDECGRKLWYGFRWVASPTFKPTTLRLFERGHLEEDRFVRWLKLANVTVFQNDPETGKQYRFKGYKGHGGGEIDGVGVGVISDTPYLLEFKTHNDKSYKDLAANGVEMSKPLHFVQMQMYMGQYQLLQALYLAINKNTDEIYDELVPFDGAVYAKYKARLATLVDAPEPPPRLSNNPSWFECKWCTYHLVCHLKQPKLKNCRTCVHSTPIDDGQWQCEKSAPAMQIIPVAVIANGCDAYVAHPMD